MADKTASDPQKVAGAARISVEIADGVQTYAGGLAAIRGEGHATTQGYADVFGDTPGLIPLGGFFSDQTLGATSDSPPPENNVDISDKIWKSKAVTGVASRADIGKLVYATDDQSVTLTKPADDALPIGAVVEWHTSTTCDVYLFGFATLAAIALGGSSVYTYYIGGIDNGSSADGDIVTSLPLHGHGKILSVGAVVEVACTGTSGSIVLNLELGTTNVTGGALTMSTAACGTLGEVIAATAVTAENEFHDGDLLSVEGASAAGTRTLGRLGLFMVVQNLLGL